MAEGHIVDPVKGGGVHVVRAADRNVLRLGPRRTRDELMGDEDISLCRVHVHLFNGRAHGVCIRGDLAVREAAAHMRGLDKGQHVNVHGAVCIRQADRFDPAVVHRGEIHPAGLYQASAEGQALGGIVVAA